MYTHKNPELVGANKKFVVATLAIKKNAIPAKKINTYYNKLLSSYVVKYEY
jgi:hypothetical protein